MKKQNYFVLGLTVIIVFLLSNFTEAATFTSATTGDWNTSGTWLEAGSPGTNDDIIIQSGDTITISGTAYTHYGNITIKAGGKLIGDTGNSGNGFTFSGDEFQVYGDLEMTSSPEKDLTIAGNAIFWGHPSAIIIVTDDWIIKDTTTSIVDGICVRVDDDFHINGTEATICGGGGISIGTSTSQNKFTLNGNATVAQICIDTKVYRGSGGNCTTEIQNGTVNNEPTAEPDADETDMNTAISVDVLDLGTPDSDPDTGDKLQIWSVGKDAMDGTTLRGGTVTINRNGTSTNFADDFVDYTPAVGFVGTDQFEYIIFDESGGVASAVVVITVKAILPVTLTAFTADLIRCNTYIHWTTATEQNNDYFAIEHSRDGVSFEVLEYVSGQGTTNVEQHYQLIHRNPDRLNYYRLRQVDFDGTTTFSAVILLRNKCLEDADDNGIVNLYPNPAVSDQVEVKVNAWEMGEQIVMISDLRGTVHYSQIHHINEGINTIQLDIADLPTGNYFIRVNQKSKKFMKMRK